MLDSTARIFPLPGRAPARPVLRQGLPGWPRFRLHHGGSTAAKPRAALEGETT
jgi:hypothetical protein